MSASKRETQTLEVKTMQTVTYYHGTHQPEAVMDAIMGSGRIRTGFHMTHDPKVAANYGSSVIEIEFERDFEHAHVGMINKSGSASVAANYNAQVGNSIETVIRTPAAKREFYHSLWNARLTLQR